MIDIKKYSPLKKIFIGLAAIIISIWGVNWSIPILSISASYFWFILILLSILIFPLREFNIVDLKLILAILSIFFILQLVGLVSILNNHGLENLNYLYKQDIEYLLEYCTKFLLGILSVIAIRNLFTSKDDIKLFSLLFGVFISVFIIFLLWKYFFVFKMNYLGVNPEMPTVSGKNTLALLLVILGPFLFVNLKENLTYKMVSYLTVLICFMAVISIGSRALIITSLIQIGLLIFILRKKLLIILVPTLILIVSFSDFSIGKFMTKRMALDQEVSIEESFEILSNSWRYKYLEYGVDGFIESKGLGNGISSYRVMQSEDLSTENYERLESHNDYITIMFEQGFLALALISWFLFRRILVTYDTYQKCNETIVMASLLSLFGIMISMFFSNLVTAPIFWFSIALNISITQSMRKKII